MKEDLSKCCGNIKDFLFTSAHRNCRVMDPTKNMAGLAASEIWNQTRSIPSRKSMTN